MLKQFASDLNQDCAAPHPGGAPHIAAVQGLSAITIIRKLWLRAIAAPRDATGKAGYHEAWDRGHLGGLDESGI